MVRDHDSSSSGRDEAPSSAGQYSREHTFNVDRPQRPYRDYDPISDPKPEPRGLKTQPPLSRGRGRRPSGSSSSALSSGPSEIQKLIISLHIIYLVPPHKKSLFNIILLLKSIFLIFDALKKPNRHILVNEAPIAPQQFQVAPINFRI